MKKKRNLVRGNSFKKIRKNKKTNSNLLVKVKYFTKLVAKHNQNRKRLFFFLIFRKIYFLKKRKNSDEYVFSTSSNSKNWELFLISFANFE